MNFLWLAMISYDAPVFSLFFYDSSVDFPHYMSAFLTLKPRGENEEKLAFFEYDLFVHFLLSILVFFCYFSECFILMSFLSKLPFFLFKPICSR